MCRQAFSMLEVLIALIIAAIAFLPIYNLFRFGSQGAVNNIYEVTASNYAADLINFTRDIKASQIESVAGSSSRITLQNDEQVSAFFSNINMIAPPPVEAPFTRRLELERFEGNPKNLLKNWLEKLFGKRRSVPNYLICVKVGYPRMNTTEKDTLTLFSLAMD